MRQRNIRIIAYFSMIIDHIGCFILYPLYIEACTVNGAEMLGEARPQIAIMLFDIYTCLRIIGRVAYPIFAFGILQGFQYSRNRIVYIKRLFLLAVVSEIPYDMVWTGKICDFESQNTIWNLLLGLCMYVLLEKCDSIKNKFVKNVLCFFIFILTFVVAVLLRTDGFTICIWIMVLLYISTKNRILYVCLSIFSIIFYALSRNKFIFMIITMGIIEKSKIQKEQRNTYWHYWIYPIHLWIIYIIGTVMLSNL